MEINELLSQANCPINQAVSCCSQNILETSTAKLTVSHPSKQLTLTLGKLGPSTIPHTL